MGVLFLKADLELTPCLEIPAMSQQQPVLLYLKHEVRDLLCGTLLTKGRGMSYHPFGHNKES